MDIGRLSRIASAAMDAVQEKRIRALNNWMQMVRERGDLCTYAELKRMKIQEEALQLHSQTNRDYA